jgi:hypothetical protein
LYADIRYEGDSGEPDLMLTDQVDLIGSSTNLMGKLLPLIQWHEQDPVDDAERLRHERIYSLYQANRNPFVDHPEWVQEVFVPRIAMERSETGLRAEWADTGLDMKLMSSDSLGDAWTIVTNAPVSETNGWFVDLPATSRKKFYKLQAGD